MNVTSKINNKLLIIIIITIFIIYFYLVKNKKNKKVIKNKKEKFSIDNNQIIRSVQKNALYIVREIDKLKKDNINDSDQINYYQEYNDISNQLEKAEETTLSYITNSDNKITIEKQLYESLKDLEKKSLAHKKSEKDLIIAEKKFDLINKEYMKLEKDVENLKDKSYEEINELEEVSLYQENIANAKLAIEAELKRENVEYKIKKLKEELNELNKKSGELDYDKQNEINKNIESAKKELEQYIELEKNAKQKTDLSTIINIKKEEILNKLSEKNIITNLDFFKDYFIINFNLEKFKEQINTEIPISNDQIINLFKSFKYISFKYYINNIQSNFIANISIEYDNKNRLFKIKPLGNDDLKHFKKLFDYYQNIKDNKDDYPEFISNIRKYIKFKK